MKIYLLQVFFDYNLVIDICVENWLNNKRYDIIINHAKVIKIFFLFFFFTYVYIPLLHAYAYTHVCILDYYRLFNNLFNNNFMHYYKYYNFLKSKKMYKKKIWIFYYQSLLISIFLFLFFWKNYINARKCYW